MLEHFKDLFIAVIAVITTGLVLGAFTAAFLLPIFAAWEFVSSILF
jgi:hypothetical protein